MDLSFNVFLVLRVSLYKTSFLLHIGKCNKSRLLRPLSGWWGWKSGNRN